ncbi:MAG: hypothetical protein WC608_02650 [Parcubacteria group bacterium]
MIQKNADRSRKIDSYFKEFASLEKEDLAEVAKVKGAKIGRIAKFCDFIITASIFALFFGLPLFFTGLSFQGIVFEKQIYFYFWTLLALAAWAGKAVVLGEMKIKRTALDIPILLFWFVYLLATIFSVDRWHSLFGFFNDPSRGFMSVTALILVYYILSGNFSQKMFRWIVGAIFASGAVVLVWSSLAILGINFLPAKISALAPLSLVGSVSGLGIFLGIMLPLILTGIFKLRSNEEMKGWLKNGFTILLLAELALDLFLFLALFGFVPWIAVMIGIGFFLIFILSRVIRPAENWVWVPMAVFVLLMVLWMSGSNLKVARVDLPVEVSPAYSLSWQVAKDSIKSQFFLGSGAASYGYDFSRFKPQDFNLNSLYNLRFYQATGIIFEALSTIGVLGSLALVLVLLTFFSVMGYLLATEKERDKVYSLGFAAAALTFLVSAVLGRIEGSVLLIGALISMVALLIAVKENNSAEKFVSLSLKASPKYALALAFVFMVVSAGVAYLFVFVGKIYAADLYAGSAIRQNEITEDGSIARMLKAVNLNGNEGRYFINLGQEYMFLANTEMLKGDQKSDITAVQRYLNNSIAAASQGKNLMSNDALAAEALAQIYENAGAYVPDSLSLAEDTYKKALELEPNNPAFTLELGKIKLGQAAAAKTTDEKKSLATEAKDLFQKSIDQKNNFAPGYYQLASAQETLGEIDGAIENMTKAFTLDNSNINYAFNLARLYQARGKDEDNKIAENLFKQILGVNDKEINTHFSLGLLYEKTNRKNDAIGEYQKVLDLLPASPASPRGESAGGSAGQDEARSKVQKFIDNIKNGVSNLTENQAEVPAEAPAVIPTEDNSQQPAPETQP